jgi:alpha-beta hydrolase superfamily lysophospholipase
VTLRRFAIRFLAIGAVITAGMPFALIASQWPLSDLRAPAGAGLRFERVQTAAAPETAAAPQTPPDSHAARDGTRLGLRRYPSGRDGAPLLVLVHGSGWHGLQLDGLARALAGGGRADVLVPDLRGHGVASARRGDVDYIGQLEDDLADLIAAEARPGQRIILGGHSSGGGLVVRFAGGPHGDRLDGAILLAPYLGHRAPTSPPDSGGWAHVLLRRVIGLSMLNAAGFHGLDQLVAVQFRFPAAVLDGPLGATATRAYTWRLNQSYAPRWDWQSDVAGLPPFLLVAGAQDEAFRAALYEATLSALTERGSYRLIDGVGHLDVVDAPQTLAAITGWLDGAGR